VASQLGHEDVEMVFRTYGKFIRDDYQKPKPEFRIVEKNEIGAIWWTPQDTKRQRKTATH
jgi:hypothetical protein